MQRKVTVLLLTFLSVCFSLQSQITWPEGQLLPSFPEPAATQDLIHMRGPSTEELYLFTSLQGLVNMTQPRIFSYDGDAHAEGPYTWLRNLRYQYNEHTGIPAWNIFDKYVSEVEGLIIYDPDQIHTVNLATMLAKEYKSLITAPSFIEKLTAEPYNLPIKLDLREKNYSNKMEVYQDMFDNYWNEGYTDKRVLIGLDPGEHKASLREYAVALGAAVVWLDVKNNNRAERTLLVNFLTSMPAGAVYMGWYTDEGEGIKTASQQGVATVPSDFCSNLTFHSGTSRTIKPKPMPAKPELENKIYVAFIISDGDNLQYVEHRMCLFWTNSSLGRGSIPVGWTVSPAMVDAMPGALNYFHNSATNNDVLVSGPSGYGYIYPKHWATATAAKTKTDLSQYVSKTEEYNVQAGIRVTTFWNSITEGINQIEGEIFADNAHTLLGLTGQNTGRPLEIYNESLPGMPLSCNYCGDVRYVREHIESAANGWNGNSPRFIIIQGNPWNSEITPAGFKRAFDELSSKENYVAVRPDHIFQLIREANGLTINPGGIEGDGSGLTAIYYNGKNFDTEVTTIQQEDNLDMTWNTDSPIEGVEANNFSVRWVGKIQPRYSGEYTFYLTSDSVAKVYINDELLAHKVSAGYQRREITLEAGEKYDILVEYQASNKNAYCKLEWTSPFQSREALPPSQLYAGTYIPEGPGMNIDVLPGQRVFSSLTSDGFLNLELSNSKSKEIHVTIYDIRGNALQTQSTRESSLQFNVSNLSKGVYLIAISSDNYSKVIKQIIY